MAFHMVHGASMGRQGQISLCSCKPICSRTHDKGFRVRRGDSGKVRWSICGISNFFAHGHISIENPRCVERADKTIRDARNRPVVEGGRQGRGRNQSLPGENCSNMLRTEDQEGQSYRNAVARRYRHVRIRGASVHRAVCSTDEV